MASSKWKEIVVYDIATKPQPLNVFPPPNTSITPPSSPSSITKPTSPQPCFPPQPATKPHSPPQRKNTTTQHPRQKSTRRPPQKLPPKNPQTTSTTTPPTRRRQRVPRRKIPKPTQFVDLESQPQQLKGNITLAPHRPHYHILIPQPPTKNLPLHPHLHPAAAVLHGLLQGRLAPLSLVPYPPPLPSWFSGSLSCFACVSATISPSSFHRVSANVLALRLCSLVISIVHI